MTPGEAPGGAPARDDRGCPDPVRGEAGRLARRLSDARERLAAAGPVAAGQEAAGQEAAGQEPGAPGPGGGSRAGARIEGADDEVRALLSPALARLAHLADLADALADGELSEADAVDALADLTASQPVRRPR